MAYLSRLILAARSREVRRDLTDCHEMHRTVMSAFPQEDGAARAVLGVLHRTEIRDGRTPWLLVQSAIRPDWSVLATGYLASGSDNPGVREMDALLESLDEGMQLRFRLHANPSKRVAAASDEGQHDMRGKRVDLRRPEEQEAWLRRKGETGGFQLITVLSNPEVPNVSVIPGDRQFGQRHGRKMTFGAVTFDGVLRVADVDSFRDTVRAGIGSGKAYGFGLLSVAHVEMT